LLHWIVTVGLFSDLKLVKTAVIVDILLFILLLERKSGILCIWNKNCKGLIFLMFTGKPNKAQKWIGVTRVNGVTL
jgi:hypothetical protein